MAPSTTVCFPLI